MTTTLSINQQPARYFTDAGRFIVIESFNSIR